MLFKLVTRDIKFGTEKSIKFLIALILFVFVPMFTYINFSRDFYDVIHYFILPNFEDNRNILKANIYFVVVQIFILCSYSKYIYDDLFTYNKLILIRYRSKFKICLSKILFIFIYNMLLVFLFTAFIYVCFTILNVKIMDYSIFYKIFICYSIGSVSLSLSYLLISMFLKESIGFFICILFIILNIYSKMTIMPGGGYISVLYNNENLFYSLGYNVIFILFLVLLNLFFYRKIDLL